MSDFDESKIASFILLYKFLHSIGGNIIKHLEKKKNNDF